jgi:2-oxoglutarate ferredoxin oxidoreductase subunit beta
MVQKRPAIPDAWFLDSKPHLFCPGCGYGIIFKAVGQVVDELNIRDRMIYGIDIGCSLLSYNFFNFDTIQTHHGRTTPVIYGVKRAAPEKICLGVFGDGGGYAIGSQHLVNSALRNEKIFCILANNTVYGMTGGQLAPTTLPDQKTETTPYGKKVKDYGWPMQGPEMVAAIGSKDAYVARGTVSKFLQLKRFIKRGFKNNMDDRGFSFLEVLSLCPTNWRTNAKETWEHVDKVMTEYFKVGEVNIVPELKEVR